MRKLLILLPLLVSGIFITANAGTCGNGYSFLREVKLMKAVGSDQSNFVVSLTGNYAQLKSAANGGQVQNTTSGKPADLVFCDASSAGNALTYYPTYWDATTGDFSFRVLIPTLHTASNDSIWLFTNNSLVTTPQYDGPTLCSTAGIKAMYPMDDNAGNTTVTDVCGSSNGTAGTNTSSATTTGKINSALGTSAMRTTVSATSQLISGTGARTLFCWFKTTASGSDEPLCGYGGWSSGNLFDIYVPSSSHTVSFGGFAADVLPTNTVANDGMYHLALVTYDNAASPKMHVYTDGVDIGTGSPTLNTTASGFMLGGFQAPSNCSACKIDETWLLSGAKTANWVSTLFNYQSKYFSPFQIVESSYSVPTIAQYFTCASANASTTNVCNSPFPVTSTGILACLSTHVDSSGCSVSGFSSDSLGNSFSLTASADYTGTLHHYYTCINSAPISSSGSADTITFASSQNEAAVCMELKSTTVAGVATAGTNTSSPPSTMTATSPGADSFLICGAKAGISGTPTSNSDGRSDIWSQTVGYIGSLTDHPAIAYEAYGIVGSGSQSCSITGSFTDSAAMAIFATSPTSVVRRIASQVY